MIDLQCKWLANVWVARDRVRANNSLGEWYKDSLAATFLKRDMIRRKRKQDENYSLL